MRIIETINKILEFRDDYTKGHSKRVADNSVRLFDSMGLVDIKDRYRLYLGAFLHDVGKIGIPDDILKSKKIFPKNGQERKVLSTHPSIGFEICLWLADEVMLDIILSHHEKLDGSGYPRGLQEKDISILVRIVTICDIYDSLIHERLYRETISHKDAMSILKQESDDNKLDISIYKKFEKMLKED